MSRKISIYQVLPRLFDNANTTRLPGGDYSTNGCGKLNAFTSKALRAIRDLGCTHIWYTGVIEHATTTAFQTKNGPLSADHQSVVKGKAGSPYSIRDYYDVAPSLAEKADSRIQEFKALVKRTHAEGLKVIIDFVPNHVARTYCSDAKPIYVRDFGEEDNRELPFAVHNNFYYLPLQTLQLEFDAQSEPYPYMEFPARASGNDCFSPTPSATDWYDTVKLNYGVDYHGGGTKHFEPIPDTWHKMLDIVQHWLAMGVDGFRCDMAEMVPSEFWQFLIASCKAIYPDTLFIAEIYQPHLYEEYIRAGFDFLYDKVGLYDTLVGVLRGTKSAHEISYVWQAQEQVKEKLLHFMENHDEQRLASDFVVGDPFKAFPAMAVSALVDTGPIMTYFAQELGERGMDQEGFSGLDGRTTIFDYWSLDTLQRWAGIAHDFMGQGLTPQEGMLRVKYHALLQTALHTPALSDGDFFDLMYVNHAPCIDPHREYYFLRAYRNEVALVAVNFAGEGVRRRISIPDHAFSTLGVKDNTPCLVQDLLRRKKGVGMLSSQHPYEVEVSGYDVAIYYFCPMEDAERFLDK